MDVIPLLQQLVQIPSVNPDGDPGTDLTGEHRMVAWLEEFMTPLGFECLTEEVLPNRSNFIARAPGSKQRPRILLGPHTDTVGVKGMTIAPFEGFIKEGKLWGRGASDTKGSMAAMLWALQENAKKLAKLPIAVDFVAFMGEESSQHGSIHFAAQHATDYEFAIVGEPTNMNIVHAHKGTFWAKLTTTGQSAHASQPETGENAILKLTRSLDLLNRKLVGRLANETHPLLHHSTLNIGMIQGGSRPNVVPDEAQATIDIRYTPSLQEQGGPLPLIQEIVSQYQLPIEVSTIGHQVPSMISANHPWIQKIQSALPTAQTEGAPWFADSAHLNAAGLPSVCMGPGSIHQAHTADEFISLKDLENGAQQFFKLIQSFAPLA